MNAALQFDFQVDKTNNSIRVDRGFDAPIDLVWAAWTEPDILDQWWAPKPWKCVTKSMDLRPGGRWHYYMEGPEGERHWCLVDYDRVEQEVMFSGLDAFCDDKGILNETKPRCLWNVAFESVGQQTMVHVSAQYDTLEDLEIIIEMGFKEGFTMGLQNLDEYISKQFYLRKSKKPDNTTRVSTYLNFPGNTEEAFNFYRSVFQTEFVNGIQRFDGAPQDPNQPPLSESLKRMVLHIELPLIGNHILMGTDAPKEMGFTVEKGNNMHINLEPDSREEADRIFLELSKGGTITMPIADMFWGAYFGSFTDQYGINWMVNYQPK
ncbi:MAG: SRPBCC domain-containing protein [Bacteroidetes bacterium]|nr:SRPBCC domain-containing protein [Bacteroidota bacterium]